MPTLTSWVSHSSCPDDATLYLARSAGSQWHRSRCPRSSTNDTKTCLSSSGASHSTPPWAPSGCSLRMSSYAKRTLDLVTGAETHMPSRSSRSRRAASHLTTTSDRIHARKAKPTPTADGVPGSHLEHPAAARAGGLVSFRAHLNHVCLRHRATPSPLSVRAPYASVPSPGCTVRAGHSAEPRPDDPSHSRSESWA